MVRTPADIRTTYQRYQDNIPVISGINTSIQYAKWLNTKDSIHSVSCYHRQVTRAKWLILKDIIFIERYLLNRHIAMKKVTSTIPPPSRWPPESINYTQPPSFHHFLFQNLIPLFPMTYLPSGLDSPFYLLFLLFVILTYKEFLFFFVKKKESSVSTSILSSR